MFPEFVKINYPEISGGRKEDQEKEKSMKPVKFQKQNTIFFLTKIILFLEKRLSIKESLMTVGL